jgi:MFS family permease
MVTTTEAAVAPPRQASLSRLLTSLGIANAALFSMYMGIAGVLLPLQVEAIDAAHKVANLGLISGISAIFATAFNPIGGALSDRTRSRWGRRTPWLLGGAFATLAVLAVLGQATSIWLIAVTWCLAQGMANLAQAALTAIVPDRVPAGRRGTASAVTGVATSIGILAGVTLAGRFAGHLSWGYLALGGLLAIAAVAFALLSPDRTAATTPEVRPRSGLRDFVSALRHRDFAWVFAGRAALILGYFLISGFQLYILTDYITMPASLKPSDAVGLLALINMAAMTVASGVAGPLSDRLDRRKLFVFISSALSGAAMLLPVVSRSFAAMVAFTLISGLAFGSYMAVDSAIATLVLPNREDAARDMGVLNIANAGPQIIAPFIASLIIGHLGGYPALFIGGGAVAVAGAFAIMPVRAVR